MKKEEKLNTKIKDSSAKLIFDDPILCAQFLRDYVDIPMLKNVQPEDIEDVTERFVHMFTEERNSDVVKKVRIRNGKIDEIPFYFISLIEHKSEVDYNVIMQIFRYIAFIWEDYEKEMERKQRGISNTKEFRYPPVLPIIFYDGDRNWTAATRLHDRVLHSDILGEYIPDYRCIVMRLRDYTNAALMEKKNALSIVMLIDKLQDMDEFTAVWEELEPEYMKEVAEKSPEYLLKTVAHVVEILLDKLNVPREEAAAFTEQIRERHMGELLAHFKGYDVQATRKEVREETQKEDIIKMLQVIRELGGTKEIAIQQLIKQYDLSEQEAEEKVTLHWQGWPL